MSRYEEELESQNEQLLARIAELEEENDKLKEVAEEEPPKWKDTLVGDVSAVRMWGEEYLHEQIKNIDEERRRMKEELYANKWRDIRGG